MEHMAGLHQDQTRLFKTSTYKLELSMKITVDQLVLFYQILMFVHSKSRKETKLLNLYVKKLRILHCLKSLIWIPLNMGKKVLSQQEREKQTKSKTNDKKVKVKVIK